MRLRSDIFVSALVRRIFAEGGFAAIEKKGAAEAGAIAIRQTMRDGSENLFLPALQSADNAEIADRVFERRMRDADALSVSDRLEKERRFDGDLWIVGVEIETIGDIIAVLPEDHN